MPKTWIVKIELNDEQYTSLREEAERMHMTVENYIIYECGVDFE